MADFDQAKWAEQKRLNPPPSVGDDPRTWGDLSSEDMERGYGWTCIWAAEQWADEMERRLRAKPQLGVADVAQLAFSAVDERLGRWGLTGFQYGCVVSILAAVWARGDELRRWHNLDTQLGDEGVRANERGTVLNPALLNVSDEPPRP